MSNAQRGIRRPSAPVAVSDDQPVAEPPAKPPPKRPTEPPRAPVFNVAAESERHLRTITNILVFWNVLIILGLVIWVLLMVVMANTI